MKSSKLRAAAIWYLVFFLIIGFVIAAQIFRAGIEVHWSDLILITSLAIIPTSLVVWLFPSASEEYKEVVYS